MQGSSSSTPTNAVTAFCLGAVSSAMLTALVLTFRQDWHQRLQRQQQSKHGNDDNDQNDHNKHNENASLLPQLVTSTIPGPLSQSWIDQLAQHECPAITARRARRADALGAAATDPIVWARAQHALVQDVDGNTFLDFTSGFGVATLGHAPPVVLHAAHRALAKPLIHAMGDAFADPSRIQLLQELATHFVPQLPKGILGCSGSDAVQAALKTAVLATGGRQGVLAFRGGYHGLAHGSLAPTAYHQADFRQPFAEQLGHHVTFAEFCQLPLPPLAQAHPPIGAVIVEPIQGRGGVRVATKRWLRALRQHCDQEGALLIYDEVYSGFGRTGTWFAFQGAADNDGDDDGDDECKMDRVQDKEETGAPLPDLLCLGKAMGGGFPISVCLGSKRVMDAWGASQGESLHTQTFLGNPLGCAMALASLQELRRINAPALAKQKEMYLRSLLRKYGLTTNEKDKSIIRGRGLMLALKVPDPLYAMAALLRRGVIVLPCGEGNDFALALIPPLTISNAQMEYTVKTLAEVVVGHTPATN